MLIIRGVDFSVDSIDFESYNIVRNLIFNKQDILSFVKNQHYSNFLGYETESRDYTLIESVIDIYTVLDTYVDRCNFNDFNRDIIKRLNNGETVKEISEAKKASERTIFNRIRRIVLKINSLAMEDRGFKM